MKGRHDCSSMAHRTDFCICGLERIYWKPDFLVLRGNSVRTAQTQRRRKYQTAEPALRASLHMFASLATYLKDVHGLFFKERPHAQSLFPLRVLALPPPREPTHNFKTCSVIFLKGNVACCLFPRVLAIWVVCGFPLERGPRCTSLSNLLDVGCLPT